MQHVVGYAAAEGKSSAHAIGRCGSSRSALPNHEDSEPIGRAQTRSQRHPPARLPPSPHFRRRHAARRRPIRHRAAGRRPAGLRQFLQLPRRTRPKRVARKKRRRQPTSTLRRRQRRRPEAKAGPRRRPTRPVPRILSTPSSRCPISTSPFTTAPAASRARACRPDRPGHRTPTGVFSVIGKERWHHSNSTPARRCRGCSASPGRASPARRRRSWLSGLARLHPPSRPPSRRSSSA